MTDSPDQRRYLEQVMARTGWSQSELAARAGLDASTLSRFLTASRSGHALRPATLRKIERASGIAIDGSQTQAPSPAGFAEPEAAPLDRSANSPLAAAVAALMRGHNNLDPWVLNSRALETAGFLPGDVLLVGLNETPLAGDVVCAQIYDWPAGKAETVFRLFRPPYLVAATADPALQTPHVVDGSRVAIKGVVVNSLRGRASTRFG